MDKPLYYVPDGEPRLVYRRPVTTESGTVMGFRVCEADEFVEGAAEEIAHALNRLPGAEELLIEVTQALREATRHIGEPYTAKEAKAHIDAAEAVADRVEEWVVGQ